MNNSQPSKLAKNSNLKTDKRLSKEQYDFDVYDDVWNLTASDKINWRRLDVLNISPKLQQSFRLILADYACELSAGYTTSIFENCKKLFSCGVTDQIDEENILNYKANLKKEQEYYLGSIRAFLLDWHDKEYSGITTSAAKLLSSVKLSGSVKGRAVAKGCPYSGAYSFDEQVAFINWYVDAYTEKTISLLEYSFLMILQTTGVRAIQACYLYCGDLIERIENGRKHFDLNVPNAKKRRERIRQSFHLKKDISEDLALVLLAQIKRSIKLVELHFKIKLKYDDKRIVPVFLRESQIEALNSFEEFRSLTIRSSDYFCIRDTDYKTLIQRIARICPLKTARITHNDMPGDLHINTRRFRYTHATNMAIVGASDFSIAEELGHDSTQYVKVYTEFKEEMAERIDDALANSLVPLSQAFSGTLIESERDAVRANDPRSRINNHDGEVVGNCGKFGFCANGTIHCYTCNKFQPWLNAPHKSLLDNVTSERDRKLEMGASEFVLQGHNRSIDAIKIVIQECEKRKEEIEKGKSIDG